MELLPTKNTVAKENKDKSYIDMFVRIMLIIIACISAFITGRISRIASSVELLDKKVEKLNTQVQEIQCEIEILNQNLYFQSLERLENKANSPPLRDIDSYKFKPILEIRKQINN